MTIRIWGFLIFSLFFLSGCQNDTATEAPLEQEGQNNSNRFIQVENPDSQEDTNLTNTEIANHLAEVASSVPEVNEASALVAGPYTVVAIDVHEDIDRSEVGTIKYTVSEALYHDRWGKTAVVVADPDLMARFRTMGTRIQEGYPVQGVIDELAAIVGRTMPEFPVPHNQPQDTDGNRQMLEDEENEELEEIRDEQSHEER
jgi:YhcN/YlaJ family sporulation lipoprotein